MPVIAIGVGGITVTGKNLTLPLDVSPIDITIGIAFEARVTGVVPTPENITWFVDNDSGADDVPTIEIEVAGLSLNNTFINSSGANTSFVDIVIVPHGDGVAPGLVDDANLDLEIQVSGDWYSLGSQNNWVGWSKIGELSFVQDKSNESGYRPMDWPGNVLRVMKLEEFVVVYGTGGITLLNAVMEPVPSFGFKDISGVGIKSVYSVSGTDQIHYFITTSGDLWRLTTKGLEFLGFSEFLSSMSNPLLNFQESEQRLFISDGTTGYVFSEGLGGGYATLTGVSKNYYTGSAALTSVPFSLMTDIIDFGHRGIKLVTFIEVGVDTDQPLYVALDFRYLKTEAWRTSDWFLTNPEGVARPNIAAVEFRVRVKQTVYDATKIDYINVRQQRVDKRFRRGPMFETSDQGGIQ